MNDKNDSNEALKAELTKKTSFLDGISEEEMRNKWKMSFFDEPKLPNMPGQGILEGSIGPSPPVNINF
jgi:hypothetical protein